MHEAGSFDPAFFCCSLLASGFSLLATRFPVMARVSDACLDCSFFNHCPYLSICPLAGRAASNDEYTNDELQIVHSSLFIVHLFCNSLRSLMRWWCLRISKQSSGIWNPASGISTMARLARGSERSFRTCHFVLESEKCSDFNILLINKRLIRMWHRRPLNEH